MATRFKFRHVNELNGLFVLAVFALVVGRCDFQWPFTTVVHSQIRV
jgi:hypothetical protein